MYPDEDQDLYKTGSYEKNLELNGRGITASGKKVKRGHVAVDPSLFLWEQNSIPKSMGYLKRTIRVAAQKAIDIDIFTGDGKDGLIETLKIRGWLKLKIL